MSFENPRRILRKAHRIQCDARGFDHSDALFVVHNLAFYYQQQGWIAEAEQPYKRVLRGEGLLVTGRSLTFAMERNYLGMRDM